MGIAITSDSATIGTTEYSLPADANYSSGSPQTTDAVVQAFLDLSALAAGDQFQIAVYEKVNAGTQRLVGVPAVVVGAQSGLYVTPAMVLGEGWDITVKKLAGTDRSIAWSIRTVT
jgi:hypothetical protein